MIKERDITTITELLQKHVHAVNGSEYRVCSSHEQAFFCDVHQMNVYGWGGGFGLENRVCVTALKAPESGLFRRV